MPASPSPAVRIAMWSGPRNISTAMMRAFENRPDCAVWDEPFYAAYLKATGLGHPMRDEILAADDTDPDAVAARVVGPVPDGRPVFYQKHMTHHMLPAFDRGFLAAVTNAFLIRRPESVLASYVQKRETVTLDDIGFRQQAEIFDAVADRLGVAPPVVEGNDVLTDPRGALTRLCEAVGIGFRDEMLAWPAGRRASDGVWAPHWYHAVEASTGFGPARPDVERSALPADLARIAEAATPFYERLAAHRL
ncbi:hypothetical protein [Chthonobacter rhizosphaerae]|uniref:sulfotransferase-like domain-containing protein n=1 Tax=Chthonobacter rhizosphaerae TaxID=2735553 RepID=UPI001AEED4D4|nr:hypothetical protein [Chthonobacter rhizosphaerae]